MLIVRVYCKWNGAGWGLVGVKWVGVGSVGGVGCGRRGGATPSLLDFHCGSPKTQENTPSKTLGLASWLAPRGAADSQPLVHGIAAS